MTPSTTQELCAHVQLVVIKQEFPDEWGSSLEHQQPESSGIKEEPEEPWTSQDGEQLHGLEVNTPTSPMTVAPLKSEDDEDKPLVSSYSVQHHKSQTDSNTEAEAPSSSPDEQMKTETDADGFGGPEPNSNLQPKAEEKPPCSSENNVSTDDDWKECLSGSGPKTEDSDGGWKESEEPESGKGVPSEPLKPMADLEWMLQLRRIAGAWPAAQENRSAPQQQKWCELYRRPPDPQTHSQPSVFSPAALCAQVSTADSGTETLEASTAQLSHLCSEGLPPQDHKWIVKTLFKTGPKGELELQHSPKLWYFPPEPSDLHCQAPSPDRFFAHPLFVWMPHRLWKVKVVCPDPACERHRLTDAGLHERARRVLDVDGMYSMVTEVLTCSKCRSTYPSWSGTVLSQLDLAHRSEFRVVLTQKFACDTRVIQLLRQRGLDNSLAHVLKLLRESHTEEWLHRVLRYTTACVDFLQRPGALPIAFPEPPEPAVKPSCKWLLSVYSQDILNRQDDITTGITSVYGSILKMGSTNKIAGTAKGTALRLTSMGNECGQILISVLTSQEGAGLDRMAADLVKRYQQASVDPPVALYVDCDCCAEEGESSLEAGFSGWSHLIIRLDIWHYMRRLTVGCTSEAHQLYPVFMSRLSACIFEWDAADLALLHEAKKQELRSQGLPLSGISKHLSRKELTLHCRRKTRGEETTTQLLEELVQELMGPNGNDSLGVPLFDKERMEHIWRAERRHVKCIQDPPGLALYGKTGELSKGGVRLPTYRCARGSTSLESFHVHLNRFIPGTSAHSLNFQIFLLEGLHRWNQDHGRAASSSEPSASRSNSENLLHLINNNYEKLFNRKFTSEFCPPSQYTGELIGVQYLLWQTGQPQLDMHSESEVTAQLIEEHDVEDNVEADEGLSDTTDDPTVLDLGVFQAPASSGPGPSTITLSFGSLIHSPSSLVSTLPMTTSNSASGTPGLSAGTSAKAPGTSTLAPSRSAVASGASILPPASTSEAQAEDEVMAVDDQNVPGYQHVDRLGEYLVALREHASLCLGEQQADTIAALWDSLDERDKHQVVHAARHQERHLSGMFRTSKKPSKTPGAESTTSWMSGASSAPAQRPDCCRLVENIFVRLYNIHPGPFRKGRGIASRWSLILKDYRKIQQLVLGNSRVMQGTQIRLVEVNQNTLIQWDSRRQKKQDVSVAPPALTLSEPLQGTEGPPAEPKPTQQEHPYRLPESTTGQPVTRHLCPIAPKGPIKWPPATTSAPGSSLTPQRLTSAATVIPGTGAGCCIWPSKRSYRRTVQGNSCKMCGQFRTIETGHSQYRGRIYCPQIESLSKEQWLEEMRLKFLKEKNVQ